MIYTLLVPGTIDHADEVRVLEWRGAPGQAFAPGELIVELETHKAVIEIRADQPGILRRILCEAGAWQKMGKAVALFSDDPTEPLPDSMEAIEALAVVFELT
jgi:pyruvate/2-oxoglutarate dehydrogenase complex dihydrolipoamide acyltransferase (E2) component